MCGVSAGQIVRVMPRRAPPRPSAYGLRSWQRPPRHRSMAGAWACAWLSFRALKSKFPGVWCLTFIGTEGTARNARKMIVGHSLADVKECLGVPTHQEDLSNGD